MWLFSWESGWLFMGYRLNLESKNACEARNIPEESHESLALMDKRQAINMYWIDNQPLSSAVAEQRIEQYMVTPGQASCNEQSFKP
jgi:hypothetical protein